MPPLATQGEEQTVPIVIGKIAATGLDGAGVTSRNKRGKIAVHQKQRTIMLTAGSDLEQATIGLVGAEDNLAADACFRFVPGEVEAVVHPIESGHGRARAVEGSEG